MQPFEQLGAFYLGRRHDLGTGTTTPETVLLDARDLTTHAVILGMTGSGKTGLGVTLLEEAALDAIPAIVIDPKGDLGNLLLTFPDLAPADFLPWVDPAEAMRQGQTPEQYAAAVATRWRDGLARWGQDGARIARLRQAAEFRVHTPGSSAGAPLSMLGSLAAPRGVDAEGRRELLVSAVSGLLALLDMEADPLLSREHILLSNLVERAWAAGEDLDLGRLIRLIQQPPFQRLGVLDLDSFFPARDRAALAMRLNNLLASPGFAGFMQGEALSAASLLYGPSGKPRVSVISIAHLSEAERMFVVTTVLGEVLAWMRSQPGSAGLRALLYMDEVAGYLPPVAKPPSKAPMLTMLKQARAYGLGLVLASQNPVDLDYKALSNAGAWFLGRLQTERDKARVRDGLAGAAGAMDPALLDAALSGMAGRTFLLHNVHEDAPVLMRTRWAMSYLRGPLTRPQIKALAGRDPGPPQDGAAEAPPAAGPAAAEEVTEAPLPAPGVQTRYLPAVGGSDAGELHYQPWLICPAQLHFVRAAAGMDLWREVAVMARLTAEQGGPDHDTAAVLGAAVLDRLADQPGAGARFAGLPAQAGNKRSYARWRKGFKGLLYREQTLSLWRCPGFKAWSRPDESLQDFTARMAAVARDRRDLKLEKLRKRYAPKLRKLQDRIARAEERIAREASQQSHRQADAAITVGASLLGALLGRKVASAANVNRASRSIRAARRASREAGDVARARERRDELELRLRDLEAEFDEALRQGMASAGASPAELGIEEVPVRPRKGDMEMGDPLLLWIPFRKGPDGELVAAFS